MKIIRRLAAIAVASMVLAGGASATATAIEPIGEWHTWEVQGDYGPDWDQNYSEAFAQPQKYVGEGQLDPKCGTWYQQDFYPYAAEKTGKTIADVTADGLLQDGEDHHLTGHKDGTWKFVYGGDCEPEPDPIESEKKTLVCKDGVWVTDHYVVEHVLEGKKWVKGDKKWSHKTTTPATAEDCGYESDSKTKVTNVCKDNIVVTDHYVKEYSYDKKKKAWVVGDWAWTHKDIERNALTAEECGYTPETGTKQSATYLCADPANGTGITTTTTTAWTQEYVWTDGEWVLGEKVYDEPVVTTETQADEECIPVKPEPKSGTESSTHDYCTEPADGTRTHVMTETAWVQDWVWSQEAGEWVLGDKVFGEPKESGLLTQDVECAAPEVPVTPEEPKAPSFTPAKSTPVPPAKVDTDVPVLARTGAESTIPLALGALALVGAGALAIRRARA